MTKRKRTACEVMVPAQWRNREGQELRITYWCEINKFPCDYRKQVLDDAQDSFSCKYKYQYTGNLSLCRSSGAQGAALRNTKEFADTIYEQSGGRTHISSLEYTHSECAIIDPEEDVK